ncbi:MAG: hypothetical protein KBC35_02325 [Candidatus Pacebacteria bacterium]|jgi:hypothetical protein|nr:hypothetical protein [Candidatus Paceibacterota bacterium]
MKIFVFGNEDLEMDSLPVRMVSEFRQAFLEHEFILQDPNEEWDMSDPFWVIDTVVGLAEPQLFDSLDAFVGGPRMSMHDFDAFSNLRFLQKLGKLPPIKIIGLPVGISSEETLNVVGKFLME